MTPHPRGPQAVEAPRCILCVSPASDGVYCSDWCRDTDETRSEIHILTEELVAQLARGQHSRAVATARRLGALDRHLWDLEHGSDALEVGGIEYVERHQRASWAASGRAA